MTVYLLNGAQPNHDPRTNRHTPPPPSLSYRPNDQINPIATPTEAHLKILRLIEANPDLSQRAIASRIGISLGKTNYCLQALIDKGFVKVKNFSRNPNKLSYAYLLTPMGMQEKLRITRNFLKRKQAEYEALEQEIAQLTREAMQGE